MEKRIQLEKRRKDPSQIKELVLDDCRSTSIVGLTDEFCNLEMLSMTNVGLTNLKNFPNLPKLKLLDLSDNRISGGLNHLIGSPKLRSLILSGNKIDNFEALEPLKSFPNLVYLELSNCDITSLEYYRDKVFTLLPNLKFLDGFDKNDVEADYNIDEENGENDKKDGDTNNEEEEEDEGDEEEDLDEGDEESDIGLDYLENTIDEESEGEDYSPNSIKESDDDDDEDDIESDEEVEEPKDKKRKLDSES